MSISQGSPEEKGLCFLRGMICTSSVINIAEEDQAVARLEFGRNGFFIVWDAVVVPEVGARDYNGCAVFFGGFRYGRHAADHDGLFFAGYVVVPCGG